MASVRLCAPEPFLCPPEATLKQALGRLGGARFVLILDPERRLLGSLTDGVVRRALLRGGRLEDAVVQWMHREVITAPLEAPQAQAAALKRVETRLGTGYEHWLPLLDSSGRVVSVLIQAPVPVPPLRDVVLMAGGMGRRLGDLTRHVPKPLLSVAGQPLLGQWLDKLETELYVRHLYIAVRYRADQIRAYLKDRLAGRLEDRAHRDTPPDPAPALDPAPTPESPLTRRPPCQPILLHEEVSLGTAGALGCLRAYDLPVLVLNADILTQLHLESLCHFHDQRGHDLTIAASSYRLTCPYGVLSCDASGRFRALEEKPTLSHLVAAGLYVFRGDRLRSYCHGQALEMPELINRFAADGASIGLFPLYEYWRDIGRPEDLDSARRDYRGDYQLDPPEESSRRTLSCGP